MTSHCLWSINDVTLQTAHWLTHVDFPVYGYAAGDALLSFHKPFLASRIFDGLPKSNITYTRHIQHMID